MTDICGRTHWFAKILKGSDTSKPGNYTLVNTEKDANLIGSLTKSGNHAPVLDIDFPARLIPSSTKGHFHLYLDKEMSWKDYEKLLNVLSDVGILERGYARVSIQRAMSSVRLPWVKKDTTPVGSYKSGPIGSYK